MMDDQQRVKAFLDWLEGQRNKLWFAQKELAKACQNEDDDGCQMPFDSGKFFEEMERQSYLIPKCQELTEVVTIHKQLSSEAHVPFEPLNGGIKEQTWCDSYKLSKRLAWKFGLKADADGVVVDSSVDPESFTKVESYDEVPAPDVPKPQNALTTEEKIRRAIVYKLENENASQTEVGEHCGVNQSTLSRSVEYQELLKTLEAKRPRQGFKNADGTVDGIVG